ncbi:MAG: ComEC/Rec2 family competence protein [Armatimonadetes bacterium]|nr:ComEC/Rec2 family competence protein [Armatimonadota bacterium]
MLNHINALFLLPFFALLRGQSAYLTAMIGLIIGVAIAPRSTAPLLKSHRYFNGVLTITTMPIRSADGFVCEARTDTNHYQVATVEPFDISKGDRIQASGFLKPVSEASETYALDRGFTASLRLRSTPKMIREGPYIWRMARDLRANYLKFSDRVWTNDESALMDALCFNDRSEINQRSRERLAYSGLIHFLAASGLKVFLISWALMALLSRLPVPRWFQIVLMLLGLILFAGAAGLNANVIRASGMAAMFALSHLVRRNFDSLNALAAVFVISILFDPRSVFDVGLHFTYFALLGLCTIGQQVWNRKKGQSLKPWILELGQGTLLVWTFAAPITAYHLGYISWITPVVSILALPAFLFALFSGYLAWLTGTLLPILGSFVSILAVLPLEALRTLETIFGSARYTVAVAPFSAYWLIPVYIGLLTFWKPYVRLSKDR